MVVPFPEMWVTWEDTGWWQKIQSYLSGRVKFEVLIRYPSGGGEMRLHSGEVEGQKYKSGSYQLLGDI